MSCVVNWWFGFHCILLMVAALLQFHAINCNALFRDVRARRADKLMRSVRSRAFYSLGTRRNCFSNWIRGSTLNPLYFCHLWMAGNWNICIRILVCFWGNHEGIIRKEWFPHSFTIVVSEASTPPTVKSRKQCQLFR